MVHCALLEVRSHAIAQRDRLSDVQDLAIAPDHHIDARRVRDLRERRKRSHPAPTGRARTRLTMAANNDRCNGDAEHERIRRGAAAG